MNHITKKLNEINDLVKGNKWLDFSYEEINASRVILIGSEDLSYENFIFIKIIFDFPIEISTILQDWTRKDEAPFIKLLSKEEILKTERSIPEEFCFFEINVCGYENAPIKILAKDINYEIYPNNVL